jgi:glutathione reductase (NADPH)
VLYPLRTAALLQHTLFNNNPSKPDHMYVPTAVFSQPHIGTCGYPEAKAVEEFKDVDVFTSSFTPMRIGFAGGKTKGYYKIITDKKSDRVVGMHMIGPDSGEIMQARRHSSCPLLHTCL